MTIKKISLLLLGVITLCNCVLSQESKTPKNDPNSFNNSIKFEVGYNQGYLNDQNFSALNYYESGLLYSLDYTNRDRAGRRLINVDVDFSLSDLNTNVSESFSSVATIANVELSYLRKLYSSKNTTLFAGAQYNTYLQIIDWEGFEAFSYLVTHGLGLKGQFHHRFNSKHSIQSSLFIPMLQILVRPPYNGIDVTVVENQDNQAKLIFTGELSSFGRFYGFNWNLEYAYAVSDRLDCVGGYMARLQRTRETNTLKHWQNQFSLGLQFKF